MSAPARKVERKVNETGRFVEAVKRPPGERYDPGRKTARYARREDSRGFGAFQSKVKQGPRFAGKRNQEAKKWSKSKGRWIVDEELREFLEDLPEAYVGPNGKLDGDVRVLNVLWGLIYARYDKTAKRFGWLRPTVDTVSQAMYEILAEYGVFRIGRQRRDPFPLTLMGFAVRNLLKEGFAKTLVERLGPMALPNGRVDEVVVHRIPFKQLGAAQEAFWSRKSLRGGFVPATRRYYFLVGLCPAERFSACGFEITAMQFHSIQDEFQLAGNSFLGNFRGMDCVITFIVRRQDEVLFLMLGNPNVISPTFALSSFRTTKLGRECESELASRFETEFGLSRIGFIDLDGDEPEQGATLFGGSGAKRAGERIHNVKELINKGASKSKLRGPPEADVSKYTTAQLEAANLTLNEVKQLICRDFLKGACSRKECNRTHAFPPTKYQCRKYGNNSCKHKNCKFFHVRPSVKCEECGRMNPPDAAECFSCSASLASKDLKTRRSEKTDGVPEAPSQTSSTQPEEGVDGKLAVRIKAKEEKAYLDEEKKAFYVVAAPPVELTHETSEVKGCVLHDFVGSPYCGVVAVLAAAGQPTGYGDVRERFGHLYDPCDGPIGHIGSDLFLKRLAGELGYNLSIRVVTEGVNLKLHSTGFHSRHFKWINLLFTGKEEAGHYTVFVKSHSEPTNLVISEEFIAAADKTWRSKYDFCSYFSSPFSNRKVYSAGRYVAEKECDTRGLVDRRENYKYQDSYVRIVLRDYNLLGILFNILYYLFLWLLFDEPFVFTRELVVSEPRFLSAYNEAQLLRVTGQDPGKSLSALGKHRELNSDSRLYGVVEDTAYFLELVLGCNKRQRFCRKGLVALSTPANDPYLPDLEVIRKNQESGIKQLRGGEKLTHNVVLKANVKLTDPRPVAVAPIGPIETDRGVSGAGAISLTTELDSLVAEGGRGQPKDLSKRDRQTMQRFEDSWEGNFQEYLDGTQYPDSEPPLYETFDRRYQGKRSRDWIDRMIESHKRYVQGMMGPLEEKAFTQAKCFVKFESNIKRGKVRPRLIMMMSERFTVECVRVLELFDRWNAGPFGRHQIKHMGQEEMMDKVLLMCDRDHTITDYSAFESSIDERMRGLEIYLIREMCQRSGFIDTLASFNEMMSKPFLLKQGSNQFMMTSRCSGHFWTSFGNGCLNVAVNKFLAQGKGIKDDQFKILAEGDDGIVPTEQVDVEGMAKLGLKLSEAERGHQPGDCPFLQVSWQGFKILNLGRVLTRMLWVKKGASLTRGKQLFILRSMATSVYHMSPGHPVVTPLINHIMENTRHVNNFKSSNRYLDSHNKCYDPIPTPIQVNEEMRLAVATGCNGFPGLPIAAQVELEKRFAKGDLYVGDLLNEYSEVRDHVKHWNRTSLPCWEMSSDLKQFLALYGKAVKVVPSDAKETTTWSVAKDYHGCC